MPKKRRSSPKKRQPVVCPIRMQTYEVMARAVEEGVALGWRRAHKHHDRPDEGVILTAVYEAVMSAVCEVFVFDEPSE